MALADLATVDSVLKMPVEALVVVGVEVGEEVTGTARDGTVAEGIYNKPSAYTEREEGWVGRIASF